MNLPVFLSACTCRPVSEHAFLCGSGAVKYCKSAPMIILLMQIGAYELGEKLRSFKKLILRLFAKQSKTWILMHVKRLREKSERYPGYPDEMPGILWYNT